MAEAYLAEVVNAIAKSKYWKDSVIIVTWDDSGGFYDHLPPPGFGQTCPQDKSGPEEGYPCGDGVRLPSLSNLAVLQDGSRRSRRRRSRLGLETDRSGLWLADVCLAAG